jgi:DNA polymerase I
MKLLSGATIRRAFIADPGYAILSADFDQIELRVAAAIAGEEKLIEAAKKGESLHKIAAVSLFGEDYTPDQYRYTKNVNFGWLYGGGAKTLSTQAGISLQAASSIIKKYGSEFPSLTKYKKDQTEGVLKRSLSRRQYAYYKSLRSEMFNYRHNTMEGRLQVARVKSRIDNLLYGKIGHVYTPFGRRLVVDLIKAYAVVNYVVQSTSRDILATQFLCVMDDPELEPTVLLPIHDELLGQAPINEAEYIAQRYGEVMSTEFMGVPITASGKVYGKSWGHGYI